MSNFVSLRTAKIARNGDQLRKIDGHNQRTDPRMARTADPSRTHLNRRVAGPADRTAEELVHARIADAGVKLPKNADSIAQELVLSASPEYFRPEYDRNDPNGFGKFDSDRVNAFVEKSMEWAQKRFGKSNVVCADLHLDERTPHLHLVVVPIAEVELKKRRTQQQIKDGVEPEKYTKMKWNRSHFFDRKNHFQMQEEYGAEMKDLGLKRGISKKLTKKAHDKYTGFHKQTFNRMSNIPKNPGRYVSFDDAEQKPPRKKRFFEKTSDYAEYLRGLATSVFNKQRKLLNKAVKRAHDDTLSAKVQLKEKEAQYNQLRQSLGYFAELTPEKLEEKLKKVEKIERLEQAEKANRKQKSRKIAGPAPK